MILFFKIPPQTDLGPITGDYFPFKRLSVSNNSLWIFDDSCTNVTIENTYACLHSFRNQSLFHILCAVLDCKNVQFMKYLLYLARDPFLKYMPCWALLNLFINHRFKLILRYPVHSRVRPWECVILAHRSTCETLEFCNFCYEEFVFVLLKKA